MYVYKSKYLYTPVVERATTTGALYLRGAIRLLSNSRTSYVARSSTLYRTYFSTFSSTSRFHLPSSIFFYSSFYFLRTVYPRLCELSVRTIIESEDVNWIDSELFGVYFILRT